MSSIDERQAKLASTLINVLVAGSCNPQRLSRGRTYFRQGAVMDVDVQAGVVTGLVQGSRSQPYEATIHVSTARTVSSPTGGQDSPSEPLTTLVPAAGDVHFSCSCPDWETPCKHAVAVMAAFAQMVGVDPQLLATWRDADGTGPTPRATVGSRVDRGSATDPGQSVSAEPVAAEVLDQLHQLLGDDFHFDQPTLTTLRHPQADAWDDPWAAMLDDALVTLGRVRDLR